MISLNNKELKSHDFLYNTYLEHEDHNQRFGLSMYTFYIRIRANSIGNSLDTLSIIFHIINTHRVYEDCP